ncbi:hypothetical protein JTE90_014618 [Oedothorax gibbosus]|uniref:methylcrotonoyl-CoA carboxylase n=1 Tax=Oedothorax gibbosus TaxID=931172 RepID=A0AAV6VAF0_9ARAC|nr:hypothetical protein JTE90_014618 [Oedothorax gibbosus]
MIWAEAEFDNVARGESNLTGASISREVMFKRTEALENNCLTPYSFVIKQSSKTDERTLVNELGAVKNMLKNITFLKLKQLHYFCTGAASTFKVLQFEIDKNALFIQNAEKKAQETGHKLGILSQFAKAGGGPKAIHRHTVVNKKVLVRERLKLLLDDDSPFLEIGLLAGMFMDYGSIPTAGTVVGIGKIHDHFCIIGANDATVKGGAFFPITVVKQLRMQQLAYLNKLPCIYLVDSGGAFLPLQSEIFPDRDHGGRTFYNEAILSSLGIPQIAVVCGSSTAGGAYCPTMAEEAIIVNKSGIIFLGGPPLVKAATGEIVSEQDLGGAMMHCSISGCTDYFAENEEEAFDMCRDSVSTFNKSSWVKPTSFEEPLYSGDDLSIISGKNCLSKEDMYIILSRILDGSKFKEFKAKFGCNLITGYGHIHGILVGILANSGALTFQDAQKGAHFIQVCSKRNIPLCFFQNSGYLEKDEINVDSALYDSVKWTAKMSSMHSCAKVPKISLCVNSCHADDNFSMCGMSFQPNFFLSWPSAEISAERRLQKINSMNADGLTTLAESFADCESLFDNKDSAFYKASHMQCDSIVPPENTRQILALCLEIAVNNYN